MYKQLFCFLLLFSQPFILFARTFPVCDDDKYNLNFKIENGALPHWTLQRAGLINIDTTQSINGKVSFCIKYPDIKVKASIYFSIYQTIELPKKNQRKDVSIKINTKGKNIKKAMLKIIGFDDEENINYLDSIDIYTDEWKEKKLSVRKSAIDFLNIEIVGYGDSTQTKQNFWIDKISLTIDNKDINCYQKTESNPTSLLQNDLIAPNSEKAFDLYKDKKIIAFGETAHGCTEINKAVLESIKELIFRENCKLVLFEIPINKCLLWNAFVEGAISSESIDYIKDNLKMTNLATEPFVDFLLWLRDYNSKTNNKVHLAGIDFIGDENFNSNTYPLFYYLYSFYNEKTKRKLTLILRNLIDFDYEKAYQEIIFEKSYLSDLLGERNYELLNYVVKNRLEIPDKPMDVNEYFDFINNRDSSMYIRTKKVFEVYSLKNKEKVVIYAHFAHVNKLNNSSESPFIPSLGKYLIADYKDRYCAVGVFVGKGSSFVADYNNQQNENAYWMGSPPQNSVESICLKRSPEQNFIISVNDFPEKKLRYRNLPNKGIYSFPYGYLPKRADVILFIPENTESKAKFPEIEELIVKYKRNEEIEKIKAEILRK